MNPTLQAVLAAIASFLVITVIFFIIYLVCRGTKNRRRSFPEQNHRQTRLRAAPNPGTRSIGMIGESQLFDPKLNRMDMEEIVRATRNFSTDLIVGDGSFGLVYKAELSNGVPVAVKKLGPDAFQGYREFRAEMETLGKIDHRNIVKILGYCATGSDRILIYEFIEKGSLDQWLYDGDGGDGGGEKPTLSWTTRVKIVKGVAEGLRYMHGLGTPIIHRDIKASNVLLDPEFEAHIADFGLARRIEGSHSHVSTQVAGTMGYMPPEYMHGATTATVMGDVYSFGVLMLEIATGKRPNWPIKDEKKKEIRLVEWAAGMAAEDRVMEMVDGSVVSEVDEKGKEEIVSFIKIAMSCASEMPKDRPSMEEVVKLLDSLAK